VNQLVESLIRRGVGAPLCNGLGLVVIETKGRKTGARRTVPVLANRVGNSLFVSTVRADSQWVRNLEADANPQVVLNRRVRDVRVKTRRVGSWTVLRLELQPQV
jgi:hypothetical protein